MPRFAILTHNHPHWHWDLLLEQPGRELLRTWRLERPPEPGSPIRAEALPEHRRLYLDYEGPVSGGRGEVKRWDAGEYELCSESPGRIELRITGGRTQGEALLTQRQDGEWVLEITESESD